MKYFNRPFFVTAYKPLLAGAFAALALTGMASATPTPRIKPAPPAPVYLKPADYQTLDRFFDALDDRKWTSADSWRQQLNDPVARSVADWAWFRQDVDAASFQEAGIFLDSHEGWPSADYIQKNAEENIPDTTSASAVQAFFQNRDPVSGRGKIALASAHIAGGRLDLARDLISDAWINHDWSSSQEKDLLSRYGEYLTSADHAEKADRQLFEIKATNTKRLLPYLTGSDRRKAAARIGLLRRDSNAVTLLNNLSTEEQKDSGVLHAATRYYRRGNEEPTAIAYAAQAPLNAELLRNTERWWTERRLLMRWALKNGRYEDAYTMGAFSGLTEGGSFADAEFAAGWIALRFLNDPERARPHFAYLDAGVTAPISKARAQYWLGRTFETSGDSARAGQHYSVAAAYPFTYYGQLAQEKLTVVETLPGFPPETVPSADELSVFNARPLVYAMKVLADMGRDREFIFFARQLDDQLQSPGEYAAYQEFMIEEGKVFLSVRAGKVAVKNGAAAPDVSYPLIFIPDEARNFADPALILGLSRQESEFNPRAYSSARARGLMQLLASTARITARKEGLPYSTSRLMDDPSYNLMIGAAHLKHLQERFDGSWIMTLAGYNAGPHRVDQWIETYGDPRNPDVDPVDWVELIPFSETRNYVQRVMENVQIYRARLNNTAIAGQLSRDLVRGGGTVSAIGIRPPTPVLERLSAGSNGLTFSAYGSTVPAAMAEANRPQNQPSPVETSPARPVVQQVAAPAVAAPSPDPALSWQNPSSVADEPFPLPEANSIASENDACPRLAVSAEDLNAAQLGEDEEEAPSVC